MGIGTSIVLIAVGAILKYAVTVEVSGVKLETVGVILMVLGVVGLAVSLLYLAMWRDRAGADRVVDREVVRDAPPRERY